MITKHTRSLCPICYQEINATLFIDHEDVFINKICAEHGPFSEMVERDSQWFITCKTLNKNFIYPGYFIDITSKCNIKCKYCFHDNSGEHRLAEDIIKEAEECKHLSPFFFTGGEPTLHPEITSIVKEVSKFGTIWLLTNGTLLDESMVDELCESGLLINDLLTIGLSFHKESDGKDFEYLELLRKKKLKTGTALWVIDDLTQLDEVIKVYKEYQDVIFNLRVKAATNLWSAQNADYKIFVSDMIKYLASLGKVEIDTSQGNKVSYASLNFDGLPLRLVSWYDKLNIDLNDINCPPWYRDNSGVIRDLVYTCIMNEERI